MNPTGSRSRIRRWLLQNNPSPNVRHRRFIGLGIGWMDKATRPKTGAISTSPEAFIRKSPCHWWYSFMVGPGTGPSVLVTSVLLPDLWLVAVWLSTTSSTDAWGLVEGGQQPLLMSLRHWITYHSCSETTLSCRGERKLLATAPGLNWPLGPEPEILNGRRR